MNRLSIISPLVNVQMIGVAFTILLSCGGCYYHDSEIRSSQCTNVALSLAIKQIINASSCNATDGGIAVTASGGSGYSFSINSGGYQTDSVFRNLGIGSYTVMMKDATGCTLSQVASVNNAESAMTITIATTENSGCPTADGTISINAVGGIEPYQYKINSTAYQSSNIFTGLASGTYAVYVVDSTNCPVTASAVITRNGPSFTSDISSIITTKCAISGCHNGSKSINLTTYANINANASKIKSEVANKNMPPSNSSAGKLTQTQINMISCWVNDGALNN